MDMKNLEERVARGAARLDEVDRDWYKKIDKLRLNISSSHDCICGQWNDGKYNRGLVLLGVDPSEARDHGFNGSILEYAPLRQLWIEAIELRELLAAVVTTRCSFSVRVNAEPNRVKNEQLLAV